MYFNVGNIKCITKIGQQKQPKHKLQKISKIAKKGYSAEKFSKPGKKHSTN